MKKTLCGVLVFVLLLSTLLTGTALAYASDDTGYIGEIPLVPANEPIRVDGNMDMVYAASPVAKLDMPNKGRPDNVYTVGYARFAWSAEEKSIYCYVIVNDEEILMKNTSAWNIDSVELFLDFNNQGTQDWGIKGISSVLNRGLQYRISGYSGAPTAYLEEEGATYEWDAALGRLSNGAYNRLINENVNIFGWEDGIGDTQKGWAMSYTECGYAVEFKIKNDTLAAGNDIGFDLAVNDVYARSNGNERYIVYYRSKYREAAPAVEDGNSCSRYDYFKLGSTEVPNPGNVSSLEDYGMVPATAYVTSSSSVVWTTTEKVTFSRIHVYKTDTTTTARPGGSPSNPSGSGNTTTTQAPSGGGNTSGGGCGSSVAIGSSVAMIALVGAAGFVTFRKKKD